MDPLDFLEREQLRCFFHRHKTEMSCMENPHTFLSQLRDHNLIQEDKYKSLSMEQEQSQVIRDRASEKWIIPAGTEEEETP